jgi:sphingolipid 4-desaturase/C4-monooxygenase
LRALAPEFYDTIPSHPSWPMVIVNFIRDNDVGIFSRAKRLSKAARAAAEIKHQEATASASEDTSGASDSEECAGQK